MTETKPWKGADSHNPLSVPTTTCRSLWTGNRFPLSFSSSKMTWKLVQLYVLYMKGYSPFEMDSWPFLLTIVTFMCLPLSSSLSCKAIFEHVWSTWLILPQVWQQLLWFEFSEIVLASWRCDLQETTTFLEYARSRNSVCLRSTDRFSWFLFKIRVTSNR